VSIGEALVAARCRAGMTVTQISQRTRINETLITAIEDDDYSTCGGDFYARGHIRAIAKVVGADPVPLIQEYDVRRREPGAVSAVSLEEWLATSAPTAHRPPGRRVSRAAALGLALVVVVVLGAGGYRLLAGSPSAAIPPVAAQRAETYPHSGPAAAANTSRPAIRPFRAPAVPAHTYIPQPHHGTRSWQRQSPTRLHEDRRSPRGRLAHRPERQHPPGKPGPKHWPGHKHRPGRP
jgi:hypothetical protein